MSEVTHTVNTTQDPTQNDSFSFKELWTICLVRWPWVLLSIAICLCGGFLYLRFKTPSYSAYGKMLIKDQNNNRGSQGGASSLTLSEMGVISNTDGFDNELEVLSSTTISNDIVKHLHLNVRYFAIGRFGERELYKRAPLTVSMSPEEMDSLSRNINLTFTPQGNGYHVRMEMQTLRADQPLVKEKDIPSLPHALNTPVGTLLVSEDSLFRNRKINEEDKEEYFPLQVTLSPLKQTGRYYASQLSASASSKTTTVAVLSLVDSEPRRAIDYLNQLMLSYNNDANADKNEVATKTKEFINERLDAIGQELSQTEGSLEQFKKSNELINLSNDATNSLLNSTNYQKEQVDIQTQITLVKSLNDYVNNPANEHQVIPANLGIQDQLVNTQITKYNEALLQYNRLVKAGAENNPTVARLASDVEELHATVAQSLRRISSDLQIQKRSIDNQYALFASRISQTPTQERILNGIGRQQEIKEKLYLTLLQKREENLIALNSTATKAKWLDEPQIGGKVSPKTHIIWLVALLSGIAIPLGIFYLLKLIRVRIEGHDDVVELTKLSIMADIPLNPEAKEGERAIAVFENSNNLMEETFRGLRTNMRFILNADQKVILCTSTIPGEGKTFVSTNLAMSYALLGKKVIILGLDIRKPQLVNLFHLPADKRGITNFLIDDTLGFDRLKEQIHCGVMNQNLDVLPAGIIPPNPGELISRPRLDETINYLRTQYDIIILDTPPVALVSDTLELGRLADVSLFICRADYTPKMNFELINNIYEENKMPKMAMVLNGVNLKSRKHGMQYGYGVYGRYSKYASKESAKDYGFSNGTSSHKHLLEK